MIKNTKKSVFLDIAYSSPEIQQCTWVWCDFRNNYWEYADFLGWTHGLQCKRIFMSLCQKVLGVLNLLCKVSTWRLAEERNCSKAKSYDSTQLGYENILNVCYYTHEQKQQQQSCICWLSLLEAGLWAGNLPLNRSPLMPFRNIHSA